MTDLAHPGALGEIDLDREIDRLIGRIVSGTATAAERESYARLSHQRIRMMQPEAVDRYPSRHHRYRAA